MAAPFLILLAIAGGLAGPLVGDEVAETPSGERPAAEAEAAPKPLALPGMKINVEEQCLDVEAEVCLVEGYLELVACTEQTKEHESIIAVKAKAAHIHAGLLLLGATPGNPAMRKPIDEEMTRWREYPPRGGLVRVSLLVPGEDGKIEEHPISRFIRRAVDEYMPEAGDEEPEAFPTDSFLFTGSQLFRPKEGPPRYLADDSGNLISLATFGDETLALPGVHSKENGALVWEVDPTKLPAMGTKITLRLAPVRPDAEKEPAPESPTVPESDE
ncbi:YdjY domain-containing protein [Haloferula sp. A504]|uniref:YdjY domain-containing protein n=1 Tax=Haloferula sp. A504 TaxID=3373601 RepID=UPI0031C9C642|nr:YdjY domain-containing protein [Verrucomicrobiaceae bacterium E54]